MAQRSPQLAMHPLLVYSQSNVYSGHIGSLTWDIHEYPDDIHLVKNRDKLFATARLIEKATKPFVNTLTIICGEFPIAWPIFMQQELDITVSDVLRAIYIAVHRRISFEEWNEFSPKERARITRIYTKRWKRSRNPTSMQANGVLRIDCLREHTSFAGLSALPDKEDTYTLTLRRERSVKSKVRH